MKIVLRCGICYSMVLLLFAMVLLFSGSDLAELSLEYGADAKCIDNIKVGGNAASVEKTSCETSGWNSGALDGPSAGKTMVQEIHVTLNQDMSGPILLYQEFTNFHQNHIRFIRSAQGFNSYRQMRAGDCAPYQKEKTSCEADPSDSYFLGKGEYQDAIYRLWHPKSIGSSSLGCWLWWSEKSDQCLKDGGEGGSCDTEPENNNRVYYPCGLGPKSWSEFGHDTFAIKDYAVDQSSENISFVNDYSGQFRNLDPDAVFDPDRNQDTSHTPNFAAGSTFKDVLNMHLLKMHPPIVCADDALLLVHPDIESTTGYPKCSKYNEFNLKTAENGATCEYTASGAPKVDPVTGKQITCTNKIPNPAGWGLENSHFMNWMRLSATSTFRKLYGRIDADWKKGETKKIYVANRMNMEEIAGKDSQVKKRLVIVTTGPYGGQNANGVGFLILVVGLVSLLGTVVMAVVHARNPRPLENVHALAWGGGGKKNSEMEAAGPNLEEPVTVETVTKSTASRSKSSSEPTQSMIARAFRRKCTSDREMVARMSPNFVPQVFTPPRKDTPGSYNERNGIRTTKFKATILHWLPMSLFYQFRRAANQYFLLITVLTAMPFSPKMLAPRVGTLAFVLLWTAIKDRFEDYQREKSDRAENTRIVQVLKKQGTATQFSVESTPLAKFMTGVINLESRCYAVSYRFLCCCCGSKAAPESKNVGTIAVDANQPCEGDGSQIDGSYWEPAEWQNVRTSDLVKIAKDEMFPADIVILATSNGSDGHCFIDTKNLDGETNLKYKVAAQNLIGTGSRNGQDGFAGVRFQVEVPHENMNGFKGSFSLGSDDEKKPLFLDNVVLRGCAIRNTDWVVGFVVYTGSDTKVMLNSRDAPAKVPHMQHVLNLLLRGLFLSLGIAVVICVIGSIVWEQNSQTSAEYLQVVGATEGRTDTAGEFIDIDFLTVLIKTAIYIVTFSHLIPMSLYVAVEITKLTLIYFILVDPTMVDPETGQSALPRNSDLVEELGQVEIIFSDKTGTLTCNKMEFVRGSAGGKILGPVNNEALQQVRANCEAATTKFSLHGDLSGYESMFGKNDDDILRKKMLDYFLLLAVCHAVLIDPETKTYQGASPDEVALVQGAAQCGVVLEDVQFGEIKVRLADGSLREYKLLQTMEFDSDRKRMSVVVENKTEGTIELLLKGADMMVLQRLRQDEKGNPDGFRSADCENHEHLQAFSSEGLRTLVCGKKILKDLRNPERNSEIMERNNGFDYDKWSARYKAATVDIQDRERKLAECGEEIEVDLDYVGITAVEDLLQEGVPETIELLKQAGLRVWVLTGDKVETAIDIGYSCSLLKKDGMKLLKLVNLVDIAEIKPALESALRTIEEEHVKGLQVGMAMDGFTMTTLTSSGGSGNLQKLFFDVVMNVDAVICCRVAPKQKAYVVKTVQQNRPNLITLSVGDGANDVAMIQEAHVGVGIRGVEGTQAVQASDFAVSQFRFLQGLLLDHGRSAYRRVATFICYYFYKNIALVASDLMWAPFHGFSGQIVFPSWYTTFYNAVWTSWPCIFAFSLDRDVSPTIARANAYLYTAGPSNVYFNAKIFFGWVALAFWHGSVAFFVPFLSYGADAYNKDGTVGGFWWASVLCFTVIITVVAAKLLIITLSWRAQSAGILCFSVVLYFMSLLFMTSDWFGTQYQPQTWGIAFPMFFGDGAASSWILYLSTTMLAILPDLCIQGYLTNGGADPLYAQMWHERCGHLPAGACPNQYPAGPEDTNGIRVSPLRPILAEAAAEAVPTQRIPRDPQHPHYAKGCAPQLLGEDRYRARSGSDDSPNAVQFTAMHLDIAE